MSYKIAESVYYKGGIVNFGVDRTLQPIQTYIWKVMVYTDKTLYVIEHHQGEIVEFFQQNKKSFGENASFDDLAEMVKKSGVNNLKFAYVWEDSLLASNTSKKEEPATEDPLMSIDEYVEEQTEAAPITSEVATPNENEITSNLFTPENIDVNAMMMAAPKPQKYYFIKMEEEFHIQKENNSLEIGQPGDYLVCSQNKKLSIVSQAEFNEKFQENKNLVTKIIGKEGEEFLLNPKVANYIDFIEKQEIKLREELYLKRNITQDEEEE